MSNPVKDVGQFMQLGGQTVPTGLDKSLDPGEMFRFVRIVESEVSETRDAIFTPGEIDWPEAVDGFLDIAYAALTGAVRLVGVEKASEAWYAIVDANLSKVDGRYGDPILDPTTGKIGKPEGWKAPEIERIINEP